MANPSFQSPRGTHDILPEDIANWRRIESAFRETCARYNFGEIRTPLFEHTELFARSAGESSDLVVTKQMYTFVAPDEQSYTLRPEGTAGAVRAFLQHHLNERGPQTKLYYLNSHFRYEAPQAGRYRQHHQCGVELFGPDAPQSDAEVLCLARDFLDALGLKARVKLNSLGTSESRRGYVEELRKYFETHQSALSDDSKVRLQINPLRIFDSKDPRDIALLDAAPRLLDYLEANDEDSMVHFSQLRGFLDGLEIEYEIDKGLVRGLDYYTRTAFEFVAEGFASSIGGGGRYNGLVEELGGPPTPAIGFGMGIERLLLAMQAQSTLLPPTAFLVMLGDAARAAGPKVLWQLRQAGISADCDHIGRSMRAQMREANRQQAPFALIIGDDELQKNLVGFKDMGAGTQESLSMEAAIKRLQALDATSPS